MKKISVVGLWHLGSVYSACFAELGFKVTGIDESSKVVEDLRSSIPPIKEPGLREIISKNIAIGTLSFSNDFRLARSCDYAIVALDTPVDENDKLDLEPIFRISRKLRGNLSHRAQIIVSSQVPVGTCSGIAKYIGLKDAKTIAYVPENLRLGTAIESFSNPIRIVVGSDSEESIKRTSLLFKGIRAEIVPMGLRSAEMAKHVLNSYLAMCISFGNEIGVLSKALGANPLDVFKSVMKDPRVSSKAPLIPGLPFSGGTLARDLETLRKLGKENSVDTFVLDGVSKTNATRKNAIVQSVKKILKRRDQRITILGLTYKPGTNTLRRSLALEVSENLADYGFRVSAYDPSINKLNGSKIQLAEDAYQALHGSSLAIIFTGWQEFAHLDYQKIKQELKRPLIIDLAHILDEARASKAGLKIIEV